MLDRISAGHWVRIARLGHFTPAELHHRRQYGLSLGMHRRATRPWTTALALGEGWLSKCTVLPSRGIPKWQEVPAAIGRSGNEQPEHS